MKPECNLIFREGQIVKELYIWAQICLCWERPSFIFLAHFDGGLVGNNILFITQGQRIFVLRDRVLANYYIIERSRIVMYGIR